jgi:hypothetical protein
LELKKHTRRRREVGALIVLPANGFLLSTEITQSHSRNVTFVDVDALLLFVAKLQTNEAPMDLL